MGISRQYVSIAVLLIVAALHLARTPAAAQAPHPDYGGYRFDSTHILGGYDVNRTWLLKLAKEELGFSTLVGYAIPMRLDNASIGDALARGDSAPHMTRTLLDFLFDSMGTGGSLPAMRLMSVPSTITVISKNATSMEAYPQYVADTLQTGSFMYTTSSGTLNNDFTARHFVYGIAVPSYSSGIYSTVVDRPRYTQRAFHGPTPYPYAVLDTINGGFAGRVDDDASGVYEGLDEIMPGYVDSSRYFYAEITLRLPGLSSEVGDTTTLFQLTLFRRDTLRQTGPGQCLCNLMAPIATLRVRYQDVEPRGEVAGDGYLKFGIWFPSIWRLSGADTAWVSTTMGDPLIAAGIGPGSSSCSHYCDTMIASRKAMSDTNSVFWLPAGAANDSASHLTEGSDMTYRVETTGATTVMLLRGAVNSHLYQALKRGTLDTLFRSDLYPLASDARLNAALRSIGVMDEPHLETLRSFGETSRKIQSVRSAVLPTDDRQTFAPVYANFDGLRVFSNDLDSTSKKTLQTFIEDKYLVWREPIPVTYANPARMSHQATYTLYGMASRDELDTLNRVVHSRLIAGNSTPDYDWFTRVTQDRFGSFARRRMLETAGGNGGPWLENLARAVDVAQFRYAARGPKSAVYALIDVNGWINVGSGPQGPIYEERFLKRPPTPEEIRCQAWLARNCGSTGEVFSQMTLVGPAIGPLRVDTAHKAAPHAGDYDRLVDYKYPTTCWLDTMWVGFDARYNAIRQVSRSLRYIDSVIGWKNLLYAQEQMSVHDTALSFSTMPMVAWLGAERAIPDTDTVMGYESPLYDSRDATYMELTHFRPGPGDSSGSRTGSRYLLVTNRRLFPRDFAMYPDSVRNLFDTVAHGADTSSHFSNRGLGNIDVRRPVIVLTNSTDLPTDRLFVEKIDTGSWSATVTVGDSLDLDWLQPGEGALYRVTPVTTNVSTLATAYPNSVKAVNIAGSQEFAASPDVPISAAVTYERDSAIYLRVRYVDRGWSREIMLSDSIDFDGDSINRLAYNLNPALGIAVDRIGDGFGPAHVMVVWEHIDSLEELSDVRGKIITFGFDADTTAVIVSDRNSLAALHALGIRRTPAIVGVPGRHPLSADAGFVIAWASPSRRIETRFVNARSASMSAVRWPLRTNVAALTTDSTARFPTLAFGRTGDQKLPGKDAVYLAFQQGSGNAKNIIAFSPLFLDFDWGNSDGTARNLNVREAEEVTAGLGGCTFQHPCIAADSGRIGVAFEIRSSPNSIGLRFRDSNVTTSPWRTQTYRWGGLDSVRGIGTVASTSANYQWPSVTQFPAIDRGQLIGLPLGVLMWQDQSGATSMLNRQRIYWYGNRRSQQLANGAWGGLMLAPNIDSLARAQYYTGVVYRGRDGLAAGGTRPAGGRALYWPLVMQTNEAGALMSGPVGGPIFSSVSLFASPTVFGVCSGRGVTAGLLFPTQLGALLPGAPPSFFSAPNQNPNINTPIEVALNTSRSGIFQTSTSPVSVERLFLGSDSLVSWLNTPSFNPVGSMPADIAFLTELVRAGDTTVLWHSDTVWARDIADSALRDSITIPSHTCTTQGTEVYVRMRPLPSPAIVVEYGGDFYFVEDNADMDIAKRSVNRSRRDVAVAGLDAAYIAIAPNPASDEVRIRFQPQLVDAARLMIVDQLGREVYSQDLGVVDAGRLYELAVSVSHMAAGTYTVIIHVGSRMSHIPFTVR